MENEWDQIAEEFSQHTIGKIGGVHRQTVIGPNILRVVSELPTGAKILDLGCGEGYVPRLIADKPVEIVGVDFSQKLIDIAKQRNTPGNLFVADICQPLNIEDDFDLVISNMVFMDVENLEMAFRNAYNALKLGGSLLIFISHPAFTLPAGRWAKTLIMKLLRQDPFIRIDKYFSVGAQRILIPRVTKKTTIYHRPIMEYVNMPLAMGFRLTEFKELAPTFEKARDIKKKTFISEIPQILMLRFTKD